MGEGGYGRWTRPTIRMIVVVVIFASVPKELVRMMWRRGSTIRTKRALASIRHGEACGEDGERAPGLWWGRGGGRQNC